MSYPIVLLKPSNKPGVLFFRISFCLLTFFIFPSNTYAKLYIGSSILNIANHYFPAHLRVGSSELKYTSSGISLNLGYKFCLNRYALATEIDVGSFIDADGNVTYQGLEHYVNATYYLALKQKFGYHINPNFMAYGLVGLSQNSIGDRIYATAEYFNKKQVSFLYGGGVEWYPRPNKKLAVFSELFNFTPAHKTLYSGGARSPTQYALSVRGTIFQFGMRYYFDY